jgi:hypothetical protein
MAGWVANGLPTVSAPLLNTTTVSAPNGVLTNLLASSLVSVDTGTAAGAQPQSVAATSFQVAATAAQLIHNTATSTAGAATLSRRSGLILTEALTTAANADYTMTLTNSLLTTSTAAPQIAVRQVTDTAATWAVKSVVNGSGSSVIILTNVGTAAANGTIDIAFHV